MSSRPRGAGLWPALAFVALAAFAAPPQRIVSVSPVETEILYGVGAFDKVVAVTEYCLYPPEAKALPKVGGWATPSVEKVVSFRPDLVAFSEAQAPFLESPLKQLGIPTVLAPSLTVEDAFTAIALIGRATGHEQQAAMLAAQTKAALEAVRKRAGGLGRPTVLIVVDRTPGTLRDMYGAFQGSFLAELAEIAGGRVVPATSGAPYRKLSTEMVLGANPDVILDLVPASDNGAGAWQSVPELNAVRRGRVNLVRDQFAAHDSQLIARTAALFARLLHPEIPEREWEVH